MHCTKNEIRIIRGNDTTFAGMPPITIKMTTEADLTGYTATYTFGSNVKTFTTEEVASKELYLSYTSAETLEFFPGRGYGFLVLFDKDGKQATVWRIVMNVVFPYDHPVKNKYGIEVIIGDKPEVEIKYIADEEMLFVDAEVKEAKGFPSLENRKDSCAITEGEESLLESFRSIDAE